MFGRQDTNQIQAAAEMVEPSEFNPALPPSDLGPVGAGGSINPVVDTTSTPVSFAPIASSAPAISVSVPASSPVIASPPVDSTAPAVSPLAFDQTPEEPLGSDALLNIKQQALKQLSPLVGHLDQTPEERFRTTMMMIQASDDASLIKQAYEAAQAIQDEKSRAQALLDIVNEINYFSRSS